ncbi:MAG: heparinase II/III family protein [Armatimonadetes bacterium]|nr:heparinase II/III family protein [Armatimonadota bacterium]
MRSIVTVLGLALVGEVGAFAAAEVQPPDFRYVLQQVRTTHPRLFLNREILAKVKKDGLTPEQQRWLEALKARVDGYPAPPVIDEKLVAHMLSDAGGVRYAAGVAPRVRGGDWGYYSGHAALAYLVTGERRHFDRAVQFLQHAIALWDIIHKNERICEERAYVRLYALSAYDWLYDSLTPEQRKGIGRSLFAPLLSWYEGARRGNPTQIYYGDELMGWYLGLVFLGADVEGADEQTCIKLLRDEYDQYINLFRTRAAEPDGVVLAGALGYTTQFIGAEVGFLDSWRAAIGGNFARYFPKRAYFGTYSLWNTIAPGGSRRITYGWSDEHHTDNHLDPMHLPYLMRVGDLYADMGDLVDVEALAAVAERQAPRDHDRFLNYGVCYLTPASPLLMSAPVPSREQIQAVLARLPRARHFPDPIGHTFMNSGWGENDTYAMFVAGRQTFIRKHYDENHFTIYKKGFLAMDTGAQISGDGDAPGGGRLHQTNYYMDTIAHNCVLIRMEGEEFPGFWGHKSAVNNGSMNRNYDAVVKAFETNDRYTYLSSDASPCYNPEKADEVIRQFLFVYPDYFVVFDRVGSKRADQTKTWLFHTQHEPRVQGDTFAAEHWDGKVFARTLLPRVPSLSKIGGPGKEFWADGKNWPPADQKQTYMHKDGEPTPDRNLFGQWRMEVTSTQEQRRELFLHLIQVGDRQQLQEMTPSRLVDEGLRVGVEFQAGNASVRVLFNQTGDLGGHIRIAEGDNVVLDRPLTRGVVRQSGLALTPGK